MTTGKGHVLRKWRYPLEKQEYEEVGDGTVRVTCDDGRSGLFTVNGRYLEGDLTQASLHMLVWTGGPRLPDECTFRWTEVPIDINRPSGWPEHLEKVLHYQMGKRS
jgi:hypothetical protein